MNRSARFCDRCIARFGRARLAEHVVAKAGRKLDVCGLGCLAAALEQKYIVIETFENKGDLDHPALKNGGRGDFEGVVIRPLERGK